MSCFDVLFLRFFYKIKRVFILLAAFCFFPGSSFATESYPEKDFLSEPLFVSLGSHCDIAHVLRNCEMRKRAFPFDWIVSMDLEKIVEMLEDDFKYFLDENHLSVHGVIGDVPLLNTYYHLEFLHEGNWKRRYYASTMAEFKSKYERRIERFRQLNNYQGKVYFIREAYLSSLDDPHRVYKYEENIEINREHAQSLYSALKAYFTNLDFSLVILNYSDQGRVEKEIELANDLIMARVNRQLDRADKPMAFKDFFVQLVEEDKRNRQ